ncbi:hypothetical protein [Asticcacaulis excentricus]|uniref:YdhG-like domain-containing protein n=1 Tax=Asticcacaulis excentricus (strain ATCC 15261 / DSM 4724 / KCTC 12464 / NCIMB 9791 / VKM B-1370 / CB 48) TaxID=573065 RepID=E8RLU9_ASTEC|nr:hypothetical protein [Asticcacaulis excentricus]ADU13768.1 Domain of unknown function DUF1801 [Asticcacaulis excentricus CB 48]
MLRDFPVLFETLKTLMLNAAPNMAVETASDGCLTVKTRWIEARTGEPAWFGWIAIKKSYVAYHLLPLYSLPELNALVPASLEKKRQGKTCFAFKKADEALLEDLRALTLDLAEKEADLRAAIGQVSPILRS